ncbi:MAG: hypothetical protein EBZ48_06570 [Proteobacteria bacterium]|nr:hypothetical protein [Pseudomonadota bacterium]
MSLSPELQAAVDQELAVLAAVQSSLREQRAKLASRQITESSRAAELTSSLVAARRVEDKAMLASDEAVAHALRDKFRDDAEVLDRLLRKPYVARLVVREETDGKEREFEYRIGTAANTECRIIDWRKAPISKLYYEYREGDEYSEEIQGRERSGRVVLRTIVEIEHGVLRKVVCRFGTAVKRGTEWVQTAGARGGGERSYAALPSVLALITAEQFRAITEDAESAVLIQGIAGSGKTTVALHRLAWLLHEENSALRPEECVVVALSPVLKLYIERSLEQLDLRGVAVRTFAQLAAAAVARLLPDFVEKRSDGSHELRRPQNPIPASVDRVKRSLALFQALEERAALAPAETSAAELYLEVLSDSKRILELDETRLISRDLIELAHARTSEHISQRCLDTADDAVMMRLHQLLHGQTVRHDGGAGLYRQLVVDEVQELSPAELAAVIGSVEDLSQLTLVGDVAQRMSVGSGFPGWEKLRAHWDTSGALSQFVTLAVSHRSTAEIMNLAAVVQGASPPAASRHGRKPIWFHSRHESRSLAKVISWIGKAAELYPTALTAVICRDKTEAKLAYSFLSPTFTASVRLWDEFSATFDEGIIVTDVTQVKGLEFTNVVVWNPTTKNYSNSEIDRNALYVALTRAEENLCLGTWGRPSTSLPELHSKLVRGFDLDADDEEEELRGS